MPALVLAAGGLAGVALAAGVLALAAALSHRGALLRDRIGRVLGNGPARVEAFEEQRRGMGLWASLLRPFARISKPKEKSDDFSRVKQQLAWAGIRDPRAVELFYGAKLALALLFAGALVAANVLRASPWPRYQMLSVIVAGVGFYGPSVWLASRVKSRQRALARSLPDALDLLVTCVEAGLGLEAALLRITREIGLSAPELAHELGVTNGEMQAGMRRAEAFQRLAARTGLEELRTLSAMLIQTELFGTSIAQALRVHASSMRTRRTHRAEEQAATVAVKMLLPLILFILPSLFSVILGPAVVRIVTTLIPTLGGTP